MAQGFVGHEQPDRHRGKWVIVGRQGSCSLKGLDDMSGNSGNMKEMMSFRSDEVGREKQLIKLCGFEEYWRSIRWGCYSWAIIWQ